MTDMRGEEIVEHYHNISPPVIYNKEEEAETEEFWEENLDGTQLLLGR